MKKQLSRDPENANMKKCMKLPGDEAPEEHDMTEPREPPTMEISRKRKLAWAREII